MRDAAASPVHNPGQQDDGKDDQNKPCEEQRDPGDGVPSYGPGSSHDGQLPADAWLNRQANWGLRPRRQGCVTGAKRESKARLPTLTAGLAVR